MSVPNRRRRWSPLWPLTALVLVALTAAHARLRQDPVVPDDHASLAVDVTGMHCRLWCPIRVDGVLEQLNGYYDCRVDVDRGRVTIRYSTDDLDPQSIEAALADAGYEPRIRPQP